MKYIDLTLSIKKPAYTIAKLLIRRRLPKKLAEKVFLADTAAWYNGRERGMSLTVTRSCHVKKLIIVWTEHRSSDSTVVFTWRGEHFNPPVVTDLTEEAYRAGRFFMPGNEKACADYIHQLVVDYLEEK